MAAVQTAAMIPFDRRRDNALGSFVLTLAGDWQAPDPERIFLPDEVPDEDGSACDEAYVHPNLASGRRNAFRARGSGTKATIAGEQFQTCCEKSPWEVASIWCQARTFTGSSGSLLAGCRSILLWPSFASTRMGEGKRSGPGNCVRAREVETGCPLIPFCGRVKSCRAMGVGDDDATVDTEFHETDEKLLQELGVTAIPHDRWNLSAEPSFHAFLERHRKQFTNRLDNNPRPDRLNFVTDIGGGPLNVLTRLSKEGRVAYTNALLSLDAVYSRWILRHDTQGHRYPDLLCETLSASVLREEGRIQTASGAIVPFAAALGSHPNDLEAVYTLLNLPQAAKIKATFDLVEPVPQLFGEGDPIPLVDAWSGLREYLPTHRSQCRLVPCEKILMAGEPRECVFHDPHVYLQGAVDDDEQHNLELVADVLGLGLSAEQIQAVLQRRTPAEVQDRRAVVRQCSTDAERLHAAVGMEALRAELPGPLLAVLESDGNTLTGTEIAEAAIATYHTDALRQYRSALESFDPPKRWAGSPGQSSLYGHSVFRSNGPGSAARSAIPS